MKLWAKLKSDSTGFTLAEMLVAIGIFTTTSGLITGSLFEILSLERGWRDDMVATRELRHADSLFAGDALNATTTTLVDGATPASLVTLSWTNNLGVPQMVTYSISAGSLVRNSGGLSRNLSSNVAAGSFALSGKLLTFDLQIRGKGGNAKGATLQTDMRGLP